ncbi:MAG: MBL fold metallo-hydrolase [Alphaproteobacteria bacterium]|nr:MBL fold metallo-hydrolase [Alphaproteobacteria bacterium]
MKDTATIDLGGITIDRVVEMEFPFRTGPELFTDITDEDVAPHRTEFEPWAIEPKTGRFIIAVQSYLVRTERHTILIDTCVGCDKTSTFLDRWHMRSDRSWLDQLAAAGAQPEEIDFVMCTHLHSDHCGWNTRLENGRWVPTFPNAKYVMTKREIAAAEERAAPQWEESISPVIATGQALLVESDHALDDQVWLEPTPGHTPGHVAVGLAGRGQGAVMCGDLIHAPIQCAHPDWRYHVDHDPAQGTLTRRAFLEDACARDRLVLTAHFPSPSMGRVVEAGEAFGFRFM